MWRKRYRIYIRLRKGVPLWKDFFSSVTWAQHHLLHRWWAPRESWVCLGSSNPLLCPSRLLSTQTLTHHSSALEPSMISFQGNSNPSAGLKSFTIWPYPSIPATYHFPNPWPCHQIYPSLMPLHMLSPPCLPHCSAWPVYKPITLSSALCMLGTAFIWLTRDPSKYLLNASSPFWL